MQGPSIVGREREVGQLTSLLDEVGRRGAALVVTGLAGIGKSTLLEFAQAAAGDRDLLVLTTSGVAAEAGLPFAGLHRLLQPILSGLGELPAPQRDAVRTAFGMGEDAPPEPFMIALGVLGLLSDAAARGPVLLSVEDAQWLDRATADALAFVARRIEADPVVLLAALRDGYDSPLAQAGLATLHLDRLTAAASARLVDEVHASLSPATREQVLATAQGNPLALCELPVTLSAAGTQLVDAAPLPLTLRLTETFAARAAELPVATRTVLRVAATAQDGVLAIILAGAEIVGDGPVTIDDLVPAVRARLVDVDGAHVRFRHPLMRSAIYQAATVAERHAAHDALAELFVDDPDRRVWHRWACAVGPDQAVAAEVDQAGRRALRRGAVATAAVAFERAAQLEPDPARRGGLLLDAAAAASDLGRGDIVTRLLRQAGTLELGVRERAQWMLLEDGVRAGLAGDPARVRELADTASRVAALGDRDLALNLLVAAASRCFWGNLRADGQAVLLVADAISTAADDERMLYIQAFAAPVERGASVLREHDRAGLPDDAAALYLRGIAVCVAGAFDRAAPLLSASVQRLRAQGRLRLLAQVLSSYAWASLAVGDFATAMPAVQESRRLAAEIQLPLWGTGSLTAEAAIWAVRGDRAAVEALTADADRMALPIGAAGLLSLAQYARGMLELAYGRHAEAYEHLRRIYAPGDPASHHLTACHAIGDFTEAAVRSGHGDEAQAIVRELEPLARKAQAPCVDMQLDYAWVHLATDDATDDEAERVFAQARSGAPSVWPVIRARTELAYGEWLRRRRRQVESRAPLRAARDTFDALGAEPWAQRARQELRAAGESSESHQHDTLDDLTPQELQIVHLVVQGLSNRAIAQRLYLSHRTIESHLYRVFPKLGVSSRAQLVNAVDGMRGGHGVSRGADDVSTA